MRLPWEREFSTPAERGRHLIEEVERIGAEPFHAPDPLPPIEMDEIHLIAWMAIEPNGKHSGSRHGSLLLDRSPALTRSS